MWDDIRQGWRVCEKCRGLDITIAEELDRHSVSYQVVTCHECGHASPSWSIERGAEPFKPEKTDEPKPTPQPEPLLPRFDVRQEEARIKRKPIGDRRTRRAVPLDRFVCLIRLGIVMLFGIFGWWVIVPLASRYVDTTVAITGVVTLMGFIALLLLGPCVWRVSRD